MVKDFLKNFTSCDAYSPIFLYVSEKETILVVSLWDPSFANTSTPPLLATAITDLVEPKSIPTAPTYIMIIFKN